MILHIFNLVCRGLRLYIFQFCIRYSILSDGLRIVPTKLMVQTNSLLLNPLGIANGTAHINFKNSKILLSSFTNSWVSFPLIFHAAKTAADTLVLYGNLSTQCTLWKQFTDSFLSVLESSLNFSTCYVPFILNLKNDFEPYAYNLFIIYLINVRLISLLVYRKHIFLWCSSQLDIKGEMQWFQVGQPCFMASG
jgi:hypothetical protein